MSGSGYGQPGSSYGNSVNSYGQAESSQFGNSYGNNSQYGTGYGQVNNNDYQPQYQDSDYSKYKYSSSSDEVVSLGEWLLSFLVMMIPCVGFIMIFVWAFGSGEKESKKNYFKAMLIWSAILLVVYIAFISLFGHQIEQWLNEQVVKNY